MLYLICTFAGIYNELKSLIACRGLVESHHSRLNAAVPLAEE